MPLRGEQQVAPPMSFDASRNVAGRPLPRPLTKDRAKETAAMTAGDVADKRLQFGRHVLDLERGVLLADGAEVTLRPKTFAVLRHLAEHPGRLISKDEFFAAVWQGLAVTDDTLVQSIGELRRALGDDGASLIRTVP